MRAINHLFFRSFLRNGGVKRDRTADLLRARQALSQLSYNPIYRFVLYFYTSLLFARLVSHVHQYIPSSSHKVSSSKSKPLALNPLGFNGNSGLGKALMNEVYIGTRVLKQRRIKQNLVGLSRLELPTSPLSGVRSNHLSYRPAVTAMGLTVCST